MRILQLVKVDAITLSRVTDLPGPQVYRTLKELQKKGIIEKEVAVPYKFIAVPIDEAVKIFMSNQISQFKEMETKTKELLIKFQKYNEIELNEGGEEEPKFIVINGKERILQRIKRQHANVQRSAEIISTLPRWLQICQHCFDEYVKALDRNVKYRIIVEETNFDNFIPENIQSLMERPNFSLRVYPSHMACNLGLFDNKEVTFNYYPSKSMKESPIIWTNHPSFALLAQTHFDTFWKSSKEFS